MSTKALTRKNDFFPSVFDDFFKPWNEWLPATGQWARELTVPAVNVTENDNAYLVSLAAPGLKKDDFNIDLEGNILTISCEKEENKEEKEAKFTRKEYSYSSFSRSFTLPQEVLQDKIDAAYEEGVLKLTLPKKEEAKKQSASKHITVR